MPVPVFDRLMFERAELPFSLLPRVNPRPKPELKDSVKAFSADRVEEARAYVSWTSSQMVTIGKTRGVAGGRCVAAQLTALRNCNNYAALLLTMP